MIGCLRTTFFRKRPIIALYFEFENELKFYNLEGWIPTFSTHTILNCDVLKKRWDLAYTKTWSGVGPRGGGFEASELTMGFDTVVGLSAMDSRWSLFTLLTYMIL